MSATVLLRIYEGALNYIEAIQDKIRSHTTVNVNYMFLENVLLRQ